MARLERRPMTPDERGDWQRRHANARRKVRTCTTCGKPATRILGDLERGEPYCSDHFDIARLRRERAAMRG